MAITYDPSLANKSDQVRFLIGDTDVAAEPTEALDDGEVAFCVAQRGDIYSAALLAGGALLAKLHRLVDVAVGDYRESLSQRAEALRAVLERIRGGLALGAGPRATGQSEATARSHERDTDLPQAQFEVGMLDNPRAGHGTDRDDDGRP